MNNMKELLHEVPEYSDLNATVSAPLKRLAGRTSLRVPSDYIGDITKRLVAH